MLTTGCPAIASITARLAGSSTWPNTANSCGSRLPVLSARLKNHSLVALFGSGGLPACRDTSAIAIVPRMFGNEYSFGTGERAAIPWMLPFANRKPPPWMMKPGTDR